MAFGHTRMGLVHTRMEGHVVLPRNRVAGHTRLLHVLEGGRYAYGLRHTRMSEEDRNLDVETCLFIRVLGCDTCMIRVQGHGMRMGGLAG